MQSQIHRGTASKLTAIQTLKDFYLEAKRMLSEQNSVILKQSESIVNVKFTTPNGKVINFTIKEGGKK